MYTYDSGIYTYIHMTVCECDYATVICIYVYANKQLCTSCLAGMCNDYRADCRDLRYTLLVRLCVCAITVQSVELTLGTVETFYRLACYLLVILQ